jgi:hypothetical protein
VSQDAALTKKESVKEHEAGTCCALPLLTAAAVYTKIEFVMSNALFSPVLAFCHSLTPLCIPLLLLSSFAL